ncbi:Aldehyde dehydrogenase 3 member I1, chloroplastic [Asimina triloba]
MKGAAGLSLEPLIGAIAAGNVAVIKPSELAPAASSFLAKYIPRYLDNEAVKVIEGGAPVAQLLLDRKWDKIFFTGTQHLY